MPLRVLGLLIILTASFTGQAGAAYSIVVKVNPVVDPAERLYWTVALFQDGAPAANGIAISTLLLDGSAQSCYCGFSDATVTVESDIDPEGHHTSGYAYFGSKGGGCLKTGIFQTAPMTARVYMTGVQWEVSGWLPSSDAVDDTGKLPGQTGWNPNGICKVSLSDTTFHTPPLKSGIYGFCTDFNGDGKCDLTDAFAVTRSIKDGVKCTRQ